MVVRNWIPRIASVLPLDVTQLHLIPQALEGSLDICRTLTLYVIQHS